MMPNFTTVQPGDPAWLKAAFSKLGLSEIAGPKHEKQVLAMYAASGHPEIHDDETAWCAAFVGWCLREAGLPNTGNLMARSYAKYGKACSLSKPVPRGAIIVWPRGAPPSGHVNICLWDDGHFLHCIGGNQGNGRGGGVTISKELKANALAARLPSTAAAVVIPPPPDVEPEESEPVALVSKPLIQSTTFWSSIAAGASSFVGFLTDWRVLALIIVLALLAYIIWERNGKPDIKGIIR